MTGATYPNITSKRLLGTEDFRDRMVSYFRESIKDLAKLAYNSDAVFGDALGIAADGAGAIQITGTSLATDGNGNILDVNEEVHEELDFENANAVVYYVGLRYAVKPSGVQVNPRTGLPEYIGWLETIGESAAPDSVVDNGNGTITFTVDSVCEAGVSNAGRQVLVYKNSPAKNASTDGVAIETVAVAYSSGSNKITTVAALGQDTVDTTAGSYAVVLLGPSIKRNTNLTNQANYAFLGTVTGNGGTPTVFSVVGQEVVPGSLALLGDITRLDSHGRLRVEVKADASDSGEHQIRVKNAAGATVWSVDEAGNMVVAGTTTQQNVVQVNSSETITGSLTAGDADGDTHVIKGSWTHQTSNGLNNIFRVDSASQLTESRSYRPFADATYDLGGPSHRWANLYVSNLNFTGDFLPLVTGTQDLGSTSFLWSEAHLRHILSVGQVGNTALYADAANDLVRTKDIFPYSNNTWKIGADGLQFSDVYATSVTFGTAGFRYGKWSFYWNGDHDEVGMYDIGLYSNTVWQTLGAAGVYYSAHIAADVRMANAATATRFATLNIESRATDGGGSSILTRYDTLRLYRSDSSAIAMDNVHGIYIEPHSNGLLRSIGVYIASGGTAATHGAVFLDSSSGGDSGRVLWQNTTRAAGSNGGIWSVKNTSSGILTFQEYTRTATLSGTARTILELAPQGATSVWTNVSTTSTEYVVRFWNDGANTGSSGIAIRAGDNTGTTGTVIFLQAEDGDGTTTGNLQTNNGTFALVDTSDPRAKSGLAPTKVRGLDVILGLEHIEFRRKKAWKDKSEGPIHPIGYDSHNCRDVFPYMVSELPGSAPNGSPQMLGTNKLALIPVITKAIQELHAEIADLKMQVAELKAA